MRSLSAQLVDTPTSLPAYKTREQNTATSNVVAPVSVNPGAPNEQPEMSSREVDNIPNAEAIHNRGYDENGQGNTHGQITQDRGQRTRDHTRHHLAHQDRGPSPENEIQIQTERRIVRKAQVEATIQRINTEKKLLRGWLAIIIEAGTFGYMRQGWMCTPCDANIMSAVTASEQQHRYSASRVSPGAVSFRPIARREMNGRRNDGGDIGDGDNRSRNNNDWRTIDHRTIRVYFKREDMQRGGHINARGGYASLQSKIETREIPPNGIFTTSESIKEAAFLLGMQPVAVANNRYYHLRYHPQQQNDARVQGVHGGGVANANEYGDGLPNSRFSGSPHGWPSGPAFDYESSKLRRISNYLQGKNECEENSGLWLGDDIDMGNDIDAYGGFAALAMEILSQVPDLDTIVLPVGPAIFPVAATIKRMVQARSPSAQPPDLAIVAVGKEDDIEAWSRQINVWSVHDEYVTRRNNNEATGVATSNTRLCDMIEFITITDNELKCASQVVYDLVRAVVKPAGAKAIAGLTKYIASERFAQRIRRRRATEMHGGGRDTNMNVSDVHDSGTGSIVGGNGFCVVALIEKPIRDLLDVTTHFLDCDEIKKRLEIQSQWDNDDVRNIDNTNRSGLEVGRAHRVGFVNNTRHTTTGAVNNVEQQPQQEENREVVAPGDPVQVEGIGNDGVSGNEKSQASRTNGEVTNAITATEAPTAEAATQGEQHGAAHPLSILDEEERNKSMTLEGGEGAATGDDNDHDDQPIGEIN